MVTHQAPVQAGTSVSHGKRGPAGVGYKMQQISDTVTRIVGRAYVGNVNSAGKVAIGVGQQNCLALAFDVNPVLLNDRVAVIATTFEKYVYQGMKFTYVPQCPTSIGGSVGLVFDRDPLQISADTQNTQFLGQVMSYEHAVLTPAYVPCATSYTRDPKELKTWFIGGVDATLTTRETSQGNLLVYISNAYAAQSASGAANVFNGGYGYIVMDYVLDLVAPTLMPARELASNLNRAPGQWLDLNGSQAGSVTATTFTNNNVQFPTVAGYDAFYTPDAKWIAAVNGSTNTYAPGMVGEIQLGGVDSAATPTVIALPVGLQALNTSSAYVFKAGQKLYFAVHYGTAAGTPQPSGGAVAVTFHLSLGSARAAASEGEASNTTSIASWPDLLVGPATVTVGGWTRAIAPGSSVQVIN